MGRVPRTKAKKPPLSKVDGILYGVAILLSMTLTVAVPIVAMFVIPEAIATSRFGVIAVELQAAALFCPLPLFLTFSMVTLIPVVYGLNARQPIFGNKSFKPRFGDSVIRVFPLVSKDYWEQIYPRFRKRVRRYVLAAGIVMLVSLAILPWGFCRVKTLSADGSLKTYDSFGQVTHESSVDEAEKMVISIASGGGKNGRYRVPQLAYTCQGERYVLRPGSFCDTTRVEALSYMISLKERRGGRYECKGQDRVWELSDYEFYQPREMALVEELFE